MTPPVDLRTGPVTPLIHPVHENLRPDSDFQEAAPAVAKSPDRLALLAVAHPLAAQH